MCYWKQRFVVKEKLNVDCGKVRIVSYLLIHFRVVLLFKNLFLVLFSYCLSYCSFI